MLKKEEGRMMGNRLWLVLLVLCLAVASAAPATAFEFNLKGEYEWRFRYWGRTGGDRDLFGIVPLQDYGGAAVLELGVLPALPPLGFDLSGLVTFPH